MKKNIAFFARQFSERGTEVAIYDYADWNEKFLENKSYIFCFQIDLMEKYFGPCDPSVHLKYSNRFEIYYISSIQEMSEWIDKLTLDVFYTLPSGTPDTVYQFENKQIWKNCKTVLHCVFETKSPPFADLHCCISPFLNEKYKTSLPVIPHMVQVDPYTENFREILNIPKHALVFGRYGGYPEFNITEAQQAIQKIIQKYSHIYFLFMNTRPFFHHPQIIYLPKNTDSIYKAALINSCDAMIHARYHGESFGLSIAEFSMKNKPIITCPIGDLEHIRILKDRAILYRSEEELIHIFEHFPQIKNQRSDWNAYQEFSPENVMQIFQKVIFENEK